MKVLLLLLLPLLTLSAKTGKTGYLGDKCGSKKKGPARNVNCEEHTSCQQWMNKAGKADQWFCLLEECMGEGSMVEMEGWKFGLCCSGLKMIDSHCVQGQTPEKFSKDKFCALSPTHTMCIFTGVGSTCPAGMDSGFTEAGKKLIVDKHNELRSRVAKGQEAGQPKAGNMRSLKWSEELAVVAQRWADQCTWGHDQDRKKLDGTYVGQNAYMGMASKQTKDEVMATMDKSVESWYGEVTSPGFSSTNINPFQYSSGAGHYTQVVWADTEEIGCGWSYYEEDGWWKSMVQCNYAIGGNMAGSAMYKEGEPCSSCPANYTCNSDQLCQAPAV